MSEYFLKLPGDSQPRAYSEYEVREFLGQGVIDSKTLTWKQGMEGWQPVAQVLPPMSPVWEETQDQEGKDQPEEQQYRLRYHQQHKQQQHHIIHFGMFRIAALHALEQLDCFFQQCRQL